ncbi:amino acid permease [Arthrobacter sp. CDRTa11]|uniref:amino acid permease n=1 Tax=Arthrobacter sp. CDRTa11 TaxID=2651199 RepID=UPI002265A9C2|nr:amino acid permease [Arthrobacter sp. CDRTa11]
MPQNSFSPVLPARPETPGGPALDSSHPSHRDLRRTDLRRTMGPRHLIMIAMGGVIGSGLFLSSGYTIEQAGPLGAVLAYLVGAFVVYLVMACLGELAIAYPVAGAFHIYAARSIGPATGFTTAWLYWLCWAVALGSEFTACGLLMQRWFPGVDVWVWCLVFAAVIFSLNAFSARVFGESEFWLSLIKVATILALIVFGGAALLGFKPLAAESGPPLLLNNFVTEGGLFPNGFAGVLITVLAVFYAFSGSELIGVAAGETKNPERAIPKALRATVLRLLIFFVGAITVIAATVPYGEVGLDESPFVTVFSSLGIPYAADVMNFVIITALLSAGNSGLYSCARMLFSLSDEGHAPKAFRRLTKKGIPLIALSISMIGGVASLLCSVVAAESVYLVLVSIAGFAVVGVWMSITASHFLHRRAFLRNGGDVATLAYRAPLYPVVPLLAFALCLASVVGLAFDPNQVAALYFGIPFVAACYLYFHFRHGSRKSGRRAAVELSPDESELIR